MKLSQQSYKDAEDNHLPFDKDKFTNVLKVT